MKKNITEKSGKREQLRIQIEYLQEKIDLVDDDKIKEILKQNKQKSEGKLNDLELFFELIGIPVHSKDTTKTFKLVNKEINKLKTSQELFEWIKEKCDLEQIKYLLNLEKSNSEFSSILTGKWSGRFYSNKGFFPGELSLGICQIGNKLVGFGALIGSVYSTVFFKGLVVDNELKAELLSTDSQAKTFIEGHYYEENKFIRLKCKYYIVDGFDDGEIEFLVSDDVELPLSEKSNRLILLSDLRSMIAYSDSSKLIEILDKIELGFPIHQNEIVFHKRRITTLQRNKRLQILSFSESQLEEAKVTNDILSLITQIESDTKKE